MPHALHIYVLSCGLWSYVTSVLSGSLQFVTIFALMTRLILRGQHYGHLCRAISMWTVVIIGTMSGIPTPICYMALVMEALYPTLGDDEHYVISDDATEPMHTGYLGGRQLLDARMSMSPDGLCLYHCIACASDDDVKKTI